MHTHHDTHASISSRPCPAVPSPDFNRNAPPQGPYAHHHGIKSRAALSWVWSVCMSIKFVLSLATRSQASLVSIRNRDMNFLPHLFSNLFAVAFVHPLAIGSKRTSRAHCFFPKWEARPASICSATGTGSAGNASFQSCKRNV